MDRQPYQHRDYQQKRNFYSNNSQLTARYATHVTPTGIAHTRIYENTAAVSTSNQMYIRPQMLARPPSESDESNHYVAQYSFENFPVDMDGSETTVFGKYSVSLLEQSRFNAIFIRVKWANSRESVSMCGMISSSSSESSIRNAVEECANTLDRCEQLLCHGGRYPISVCSIEYLNNHHIVVMDKVDESFPNAVYWCTLCDYHMSSIQHVRSHFEQNQHFADEQRMQERSSLMKKIPQLATHQLEAINSTIHNLLHSDAEDSFRDSIWKQRMELLTTVEQLLKRCVFEKMRVRGHVRVYGSTVAKTATERSDLNITIDIPSVDCSDAVDTMKNVAKLLNEAATYIGCIVIVRLPYNFVEDVEDLGDFEAQFLAETPMCIRLIMSNILVRITWRRENGLKLGSLLGTYAAFRSQFAELCIVVRKWAETCGIYSVEKKQGGLTSYGFDLMVLYFLQQKGLLPCLHELRPMMAYDKKIPHMIDDFYERRDIYENDLAAIAEKFGKPKEPWNMALLFVEFLCFYGSRAHQNEVVQVITKNIITRDKTRWSRKLLQIADPFRTDNVVTFTKSYQAYFFNCFLKSYLYFAIPQTTEGPLLDVTLYQKMGESPRKKKSKRRKVAATPGNDMRNLVKQDNTIEDRLPYCSVEPIEIDDAEYTAAADALVVDEEKRAEINKEIMENLMPVPKLLNSIYKKDAKDGSVDRTEDQHSLNIAFTHGLRLQGNRAQDVVNQLVVIAKTAANSEDVVLGCSLVDLPDKLCGSHTLPTGEVFFIPERSACGFLVNSRWTGRVVDVARLKKGLCEITLRISPGHELKLLYCLQLCNTYPLRRLQERMEELQYAKGTSVVVIFGSDGTCCEGEIQLAEECEALGLDVWTGLFREEIRTFIATKCSSIALKVEDLILEEIEKDPFPKKCYVVRAAISSNLKDRWMPSEDNDDSREEVAKNAVKRVVAQVDKSKRMKEGKIKRAERRRQEKERAAQLLERVIEEEKAALKATSPHIQDEEAISAMENLFSQKAIANHLAMTDDGKLDERPSKDVSTPKTRRKISRENSEKIAVGASGNVVHSEPNEKSCDPELIPSLPSEEASISQKKISQDSRSAVLTLEDKMRTSLVHDIPLKDLTPLNVEIDDDLVYSRRSMHRIRKYNPIPIPRASFDKLERYRINRRSFKERDKEVDFIQDLRRQKVRNERKRMKLRTEIGEGIDEEVKHIEEEMKDLNPFDLCGNVVLTDEDWLSSVQIDEDSMPDITVDSIDDVDAAEPSENGATLEQQVKENQPKALVCYEDFFITLKDFDPSNFRAKVDKLEKECFVYSFEDAENFNNGYKPDMVCASCESCEHWSDACPMMTIPTVENLSLRKEEFEWIELNYVILGTYEKNRVSDHRLEKLYTMVGRIRSFLEKDLRRPVRLDIFGSLVNGLGAGGSDVDICFRFSSDDQPLNVDEVEIVREISLSLQKMKGLERVYAITGAKVPIVKFLWPKFGFEGDISYYNVLALYNTQLLKSYCAWDQRVAPVGVWVKRWAKSCDIGDASRGSLSSYAIIILLIHYLQNCDPPVLPRLQEDFRNGETCPVWVENHDVYYYQTVLEQWSQNRSSVAQLFIGFLDYYAHFDFETQVVQIRRKKPLLKMEKDWNRSMCIEDPFDLNHNLGSGVTRKMFVFIVRNIHNSRKQFMLSVNRRKFLEEKGLSLDKQMPPNLIEEYGATLLKQCEMGSAPSDRQCRICHRVGHFAESCPKNHGLRTPRREPWPKRAPNGNGEGTPRSNPLSTRSYTGARSFYRKVERPPWQNGRPPQ